MAAPTDFPDFSTDTNFTNGPQVGTATKVEPTAGELAEGYVPGTATPAQKMNWWMNLVGRWVRHFADERLPAIDAAIAAIIATSIPNAITAAVEPGTYAPTLSNPQDISSATVSAAWYSRVGNTVHVELRVAYTSGATGLKAATITLPLDPGANFANAYELIGTCAAHQGVESDNSGAGYVRAIVSTKTARVVWTTATGSGTDLVSVHFSYRVS